MMNKVFYRLLVATFAILSFTFTSCSDDHEGDGASSGDNITINGVSFPISKYFSLIGTWNEDGDNKGWFCLPVTVTKNGVTDILYYEFSFKSTSTLSKGDKVSDMSLTLQPYDNSQCAVDCLLHGELPRVSGSATIESVTPSKSEMVVKFDNLKMESSYGSYTFNGSALIDFIF